MHLFWRLWKYQTTIRKQAAKWQEVGTLEEKWGLPMTLLDAARAIITLDEAKFKAAMTHQQTPGSSSYYRAGIGKGLASIIEENLMLYAQIRQ